MTQTLKNAATVLLVAVGCLAALWLGVRIGDAIQPQTPAPTSTDVQMQRIDAIPDVVGSETLSPVQQAQAEQARDRVCEGMTAGVPLYLMDAPVAEQGGMSLDAAHEFVTEAAQACLAGGR